MSDGSTVSKKKYRENKNQSNRYIESYWTLITFELKFDTQICNNKLHVSP